MEKNNKGVIVFLIGVIILLIVLCILQARGIVDFDKKDSNNDEDNYNKLVGTYTYKGEYYDKESVASGEGFNDENAYVLGKMTYEVLTLNSDGSAIMSVSNARGSGSSGKGKWTVVGDKILVDNDECVEDGNCQAVWVYSYVETNEEITIKSSNSNVAIVYLIKDKNDDSNSKNNEVSEAVNYKITLGEVSIDTAGVNSKLYLDGTLDLSYDSNEYLGAKITGYCLGSDNEKYLIHGPGDGATLYYNVSDGNLLFTENVPQDIEYNDGTKKDTLEIDWNSVKIKYCKIDRITFIGINGNDNLDMDINIEKYFD